MNKKILLADRRALWIEKYKPNLKSCIKQSQKPQLSK